MSVYDYINDANEIKKFKMCIVGLNYNIEYHTDQIKKDKKTIELYNKIIYNLEKEKL